MDETETLREAIDELREEIKDIEAPGSDYNTAFNLLAFASGRILKRLLDNNPAVIIDDILVDAAEEAQKVSPMAIALVHALQVGLDEE